MDLAPLAEMIKENIKEVYLIGVIADKIESELKKIGYEDSRIHKLVNIENSLQDMKKRFTKDSDEVILLSPATSSYDQFNSFEHRGKVFKELVLKIFWVGAKNEKSDAYNRWNRWTYISCTSCCR